MADLGETIDTVEFEPFPEEDPLDVPLSEPVEAPEPVCVPEEVPA